MKTTTQQAHTPGPWKLATYRASDHSSLSVVAEVDGSPWEVACAIGWGGDGADEAGANARLIAAAPDLLAACIEVLEQYDLYGSPEDKHAKKLRAAITAATGEQA